MAQDTPMSSNIGGTSSTDFGTGSQTGSRLGSSQASKGTDLCPTCGRSNDQNRGLEQFLGRLGISDDMIQTLKTSVQNVEVEEYLNTAREYLATGGTKAKTFAKENPGKVAAGVAVLAVGAGLLVSALNKE